jgi:hypothetical protein
VNIQHLTLKSLDKQQDDQRNMLNEFASTFNLSNDKYVIIWVNKLAIIA